MITSGPLTVHHSHPHSPLLHRYITVYLPSGSCHSDVTSLPPPLPLPLISRLDARTGSAVRSCLAARTRCAAHFFSFIRSCGDVTFLCVGPPYERNIRRYHVKTLQVLLVTLSIVPLFSGYGGTTEKQLVLSTI